MDPFSIVASTVGVLSQCLEATKITLDVIEGLKRPQASHLELLKVLTDLRVVLRVTESLISTEQVLSSPSFPPLLKVLNNIGKILVAVTQKVKKTPSTGIWSRTGVLRNIDKEVNELKEAVSTLQVILSDLNLLQSTKILSVPLPF